MTMNPLVAPICGDSKLVPSGAECARPQHTRPHGWRGDGEPQGGRAMMPNTTDAETLWISVQNQIPGGVVGALIILIVGWVIARLLQAGVTAALRRTGLDRRLAPAISNDPAATTAPGDTAQVIGRIVFWLVMVFVLIAVLDALGLELVTAPLTGLLAGIFEFLPRLFAAILILVLGWLLARIASQIVTSVLAAMGVDRLATRLGFAKALGTQRLSGILGTIVYILILLPVITAALDALQLEALTLPLTNMINQVLAAIPNIVAAVILVTLAYFVGRVLADLVTSVLTGLGVNAWPARLGLATPTAGAGTSVRTASASASTGERLRHPLAGRARHPGRDGGDARPGGGGLVRAHPGVGAARLRPGRRPHDRTAGVGRTHPARAGHLPGGALPRPAGRGRDPLQWGRPTQSPGDGGPGGHSGADRGDGAAPNRRRQRDHQSGLRLAPGCRCRSRGSRLRAGGREVAGRELQDWVQAAHSGEAEQRAAQLQADAPSASRCHGQRQRPINPCSRDGTAESVDQ